MNINDLSKEIVSLIKLGNYKDVENIIRITNYPKKDILGYVLISYLFVEDDFIRSDIESYTDNFIKNLKYILDLGADVNWIYPKKIEDPNWDSTPELNSHPFSFFISNISEYHENLVNHPLIIDKIKLLLKKVTEVLINYGLDINALVNKGMSYVDEAYNYDNFYAVEYLKSVGGKHTKNFVMGMKKIDSKYNNEPYIDFDRVDDFPPKFHREIERLYKNKLTSTKSFIESITIESLSNLIKSGLDINQKDWKGRTPLDFATQIGNTEAVNFLIENGGKTSKELKNQRNS